MTTKPSRIWRAFESSTGLTRSAADWKRLLGHDFEAIMPFLRPRQGLATSVPCLAKPPCGCNHGVVEHGRDDLVSVCRCSPKRCRTAPLQRLDAVVWEVNLAGLGAAIAAAFSIKYEERSVDGLRMTWQIGSFTPRVGTRIPLFLTIQTDSEDFKSAVTSLAATADAPFILLAPTEDHWKPEYESVFRAKNACFLALADILDCNGKMSAKQPLADVLADFLEKVLPPPKDQYELCREGATWRAVFRGEPKSVPDSKGMAHIALLLSMPNREVHCTQLYGGISGIPVPSSLEPRLSVRDREADEDEEQPKKMKGERLSVDAVADSKTIDKYRRGLDELKEKIEDARELGNSEGVSRLTQEQHVLTKEIARLVGYSGKVRREGPTKRARQAVSKAIGIALTATKKAHLALWKHLDTSIQRGEFLAYRAQEDIRWVVQR